MSNRTDYLFWCAHEHVSFRMPEIDALLSLLQIDCKWLEVNYSKQPFLVASLKSEDDVRKLLSRSILIRSAFELWAQGDNKKQLIDNLQSLPKTFMEPYCNESFKILVETYGKKISLAKKVEKMEDLDFLPFKGPIKLNNPDHQFCLLEYYGMNPNEAPEEPQKLYFGRWVCDGQRRSVHEMNLSERKFIGNTSMDPTLALIMSNMAKVNKNSLVLDPFVGSGSLMVAAAKFGGLVFGTDIDYQMLLGKAKPSRINQKKRLPEESIRLNMCQYHLESHYLDVIVADTALPLWREKQIFDAIITDPPYGIREATERIGSKKNNKVPDHLAEKHIPSKICYSLQDILRDLLNFSALHLSLNGRLVYWLPVFKEEFELSDIPSHPAFKLISCCDQTLSKSTARYLITMEKIQEIIGKDDCATVPSAARRFRENYFGSLQTQ